MSAEEVPLSLKRAEVEASAIREWWAVRGRAVDVRIERAEVGRQVEWVVRIASPVMVPAKVAEVTPVRRSLRRSVARADWPAGSNARLLARQTRVSGGFVAMPPRRVVSGEGGQ